MFVSVDRENQPPFFVVGAQRSGTTMLRLMLNKHPEVSVPFESGFIVDFFRVGQAYGDLAHEDNARRLLLDIAAHPLVRKGALVPSPDAVLRYPIRCYRDVVDAIFRVHALGQGKQRWGDKTPSYVTEVDTLRAIFPHCKIVHLVRDGRDVAISNRNVEWGIRSLPRAAADWRWKTLLAHKVGSVLGPDYLMVRYEDLVAQPEASLRRIAEFLGIEYTPAMLDYPDGGAAQMPLESMRWHRNSIRAPDVALVGQWKRAMARSDRIIFEQCAGDALKTFGYELEGRSSTLGSRLRNLYFATMMRY